MIRRELNLEQNNQRRIRHGAQLLRKPSLPEKKMNAGAPNAGILVGLPGLTTSQFMQLSFASRPGKGKASQGCLHAR